MLKIEINGSLNMECEREILFLNHEMFHVDLKITQFWEYNNTIVWNINRLIR